MKTTHRIVTFYSPGSFFSETNEVEVPLDATLGDIAKRAKTISQRYGATPYGFSIERRTEESVTQGGKVFKAEPVVKPERGMVFLTGRVLTLRDIPDDGEHRILRSNMSSNGWRAVVENTNSYRATHPFERDDIVIDWEGNVVAHGEDYYKATPARLP